MLAELVERWASGAALAEVAHDLRTLSLADTIVLAARLRIAGYGTAWGRLDALARIDTAELACLLSMHRSGYVRAAALHELVRVPEPFALRFLVMRLDDFVDTTREHARVALWDRLEPAYHDELISLLPLIAASARRQRATSSTVLRDVGTYLERTAVPALRRAAVEGDRAVRRHVMMRLARTEEPAFLIERLADPDPRIGRMIASIATSYIAEPATREALLPVMEHSRDPEVRRRAVLARARNKALLPYVYRALTDVRARVRHTAREKLPNRARRACLDGLGEPQRLLGALGGLAEAGQPEDAVRVVEFTMHADPRIRAEAYRTLGKLAPEHYADLLREAAHDPSARVRKFSIA